MGVFIWVKGIKKECPVCGAPFRKNDWQSKFLMGRVGRRWYHLALAQQVSFNSLIKGEVYNVCERCHVFSSGKIKNGKVENLRAGS